MPLHDRRAVYKSLKLQLIELRVLVRSEAWVTQEHIKNIPMRKILNDLWCFLLQKNCFFPPRIYSVLHRNSEYAER